MAASPDKELEEQLLEAGKRLLQPPSSVDELLPLLDEVENFLSKVVQSPPESMHSALSPLQNALIADELLRHSNVDVKVSVASCISEITRISAPDAPYDDDQMKEVFQLIVSSFENLSDKSSRSYSKRTSILETVAKVRSCVVMLDLECDALISEMFQHFLKSIRDYHPETVFTSMETIMILVLDESEDISVELLTPILASLKKDSEETLPIAQKLGSRVFQNCASKLKPYLIQAVKSLGIFLDDYTDVVASICLEKSGSVEQGDGNVSGEKQVTRENAAEGASHEEVDAVEESSLKQVDNSEDRSLETVDGATQTADGGSLSVSDTSKKLSSGANVVLDTGKTADLEVEIEQKEQTSKRRGIKPVSLMNSTEHSDPSHVDGDKESDELPNHPKSCSKETDDSRPEDSSEDATAPLKNEKEMALQVSSLKGSDSEAANVAAPDGSGHAFDETQSRKVGRSKKRAITNQEAKASADIPKKAHEETTDSEVKTQRRGGKKGTAGIAEDGNTPPADKLKKEINLGNSEEKPSKPSGKKVDSNNKNQAGSSSRQQQGRKMRGREKGLLEKDGMKSFAEDDVKKTTSPKSATKPAKAETTIGGTLKVNSKRKRTPGKGKVPDGKNLVGSKIKVWWPEDEMYYDGVIESFDPVEKKHKVSYFDGDEEILNLKDEDWEFIEDKSASAEEQEQEPEQPSPDATPDMYQKKKAKTNLDVSLKKSGVVSSSKRAGGTSLSKSKVSATKAGRVSRDGDKVKDVATKAINKSEDMKGAKAKGRTSKGGGKAGGDAPKTTSKSMDSDVDTPKTRDKLKQETPKSSIKSKGKASGSKSNVIGSGKTKSSSSKVKENEDLEKPPVSGKASGSGRGKSSDPSKGQNSEAKSGKKRRRG